MIDENSLENGTIEFRHYAIQSRLGAKKKIQNLLNSNKEIPDLGKYNSIEEYMNAMSGSGLWLHMARGIFIRQYLWFLSLTQF